MKGFKHWYQNLSIEQTIWLMTILITAATGTLLSGLVLKWGMSSFGQNGGWAQLMVSLGATAVYAAIIIAVFTIFFPTEMRLAWKRLHVHKK
jgi:hypothetical protein